MSIDRLKQLCCCALLALACIPAEPPSSVDGAGVLALTGVNVVPMDRETVLSDHDVLVEFGRISALGPAGRVEIPERARVVDASGRYLMPGLFDVHVHVDREDELLMYLAGGVTTVLNLHGEDWHLEWGREIEGGRRFGPRLLSCGPPLRGGEVSAAEIPQRVAEIAEAGYECVKIRGDWTSEAYRGVAEATEAAELLLMGHLPRNLPLDFALNEGRQRVVHLEELVYTHEPFDAWIEAGGAETTRASAAMDLGEEIRSIAGRVADAGMWVVPSQIVIDNYLARSSEQGRLALASRPYLRFLDPVNRRAWARASVGNSERFRRQTDLQHQMLRAFREAGVKLALGTDANVSDILNVMPGWSVHEELGILGATGYSPYEALRQATVSAAAYLGLEGEGVVRDGARADLLILEGNPLKNLRHARAPYGVVARGEWLPRQDIDRRLEALEASFADLEAAIARLDAVWDEGLESTAAAYRALEEPSPDLARYLEGRINSQGYSLLGDGDVQGAIEAFRRNTELFPESANTYDSLGEAYLESGDRETAIRLYRRALEVDASFRNAARMLEELGG